MRIVHVDTGDAMQGGQWQVLYLLRGLRRKGHEQVLIARGELAERALADQFEVRSGGAIPPWDLVHAHDARAHTWAALRSRKPLVVARRVGFPVRRSVLSTWKYRRARHFIAVSKYTAATLAAVGLKPETISVVYDGVPIPARPEAALDGPVAAIMKDKTSGLLMDAARMAGVAVEPVGELMTDLNHARALAYITGMQGLGSGAIAAMARGVPVIASRVGGLPEVVVDGVTGLLVDNDIKQISEALGRLQGDRALAAKMGAAGRERAMSLFSQAAMVDGTEAAYRKALA